MNQGRKGNGPGTEPPGGGDILRAPNGLKRAALSHAAIGRAFLARGGTLEQWDRVCEDPRKFNLAWNRLLGLPDSVMPPPEHLRNVDPNTGEIFEHE